MKNGRVLRAAEVAEADWIRPRLARFGASVSSVVPTGFAAYVRILHPAYGAPGQLVRWADVAARSCSTMHRLAQFHGIAEPWDDAPPECLEWDGGAPESGNLEAELLRVLCSILADHTTSASSCRFCLWDGYDLRPSVVATATPIQDVPALRPSPGQSSPLSGQSPPAPAQPPPSSSASATTRTLVHLPYRDYFLLSGPLDAALEVAKVCGASWSQSPNLFWPEDHAWCVGTEIDLYCTLVAGTEALADALVADTRLEAWRVEPDDPISYDSDEINT